MVVIIKVEIIIIMMVMMMVMIVMMYAWYSLPLCTALPSTVSRIYIYR
jgi:hypothetical protein